MFVAISMGGGVVKQSGAWHRKRVTRILCERTLSDAGFFRQENPSDAVSGDGSFSRNTAPPSYT
jgi:hypothetical protein